MTVTSIAKFRSIFQKDRYYAYVVNGSKGSGKSTWLEYAAEKFLLMGFLVFDFWAAPYENLFWCLGGRRDPSRKKDSGARVDGYPVLIIHPPTVELNDPDPKCTCGANRAAHADPEIKCKRFVPIILTVTDETSLADIVKMVLDENRKLKRIIVFNEAFYDDLRDAYKVLVRYLKEYPILVKRGIIPNEVGCCCVFREVADLVTGGVKVIAGNYATETRRSMQVMIRKCRHMHTQLLCDSQRNDDIAASVSENRDYLILKQSTLDLIPEKYRYIPEVIDEERELAIDEIDYDRAELFKPIALLQKWEYYIVFPDGTLELRMSGQPGFMHKGEHDDWFKLTGLTPTYSEIRQAPKHAEARAQDIKNKADRAERRKALIQKAYLIHEKDRKSFPKIYSEDLPEWSEFGSAEGLKKAVQRGLRDGTVTPV